MMFNPFGAEFLSCALSVRCTHGYSYLLPAGDKAAFDMGVRIYSLQKRKCPERTNCE